MGEVVGAALVAHVPTIMLPEEVRLEINEGREITLVPGLRRMKSDCLDRLKPDTVIVFDTHWESTFEHIVTSAEPGRGSSPATNCHAACARSRMTCQGTRNWRT